MGQPLILSPAGRGPAAVAVALVLAGAALSGLVVTPRPARAAALVATGIADSYTVRHDRSLVVAAPGVLANDLNLLGDSTAELVSGVAYGELDLDASGGFTYEPGPGFVGTDSFRYRPSGLLSTAAKVTISVTNAVPVARPDTYTWPGGTLSVPAPGVLANDTDADGDLLIAEIDGGGISGSFDLDEDGGFRYEPGGGFSGSGTVHYRVWDGVAWSAATTITLTVQAPTPTPTPIPTPTPTPLLPLPSLPLPLASIAPSPSIAPTPIATQEPPRSPSSLAPEPADENGGAGEGPRSSGTPGSGNSSATPGSVGSSGSPSRPGGQGDSSGDGGPPAAGEGTSRTSGLLFDRDRLDLRTGGFGILAGFHVWAVPAATLGVPGLLVLLWVALQAGGGLAWIPAIRRLRGTDRRTAA